MLRRALGTSVVTLTLAVQTAGAAVVEVSSASMATAPQLPLTDTPSSDPQTLETVLLGPAVEERLLAPLRLRTDVFLEPTSVSPVPEPGILTLMVAGVLALTLVRRLRSADAQLAAKPDAAKIRTRLEGHGEPRQPGDIGVAPGDEGATVDSDLPSAPRPEPAAGLPLRCNPPPPLLKPPRRVRTLQRSA